MSCRGIKGSTRKILVDELLGNSTVTATNPSYCIKGQAARHVQIAMNNHALFHEQTKFLESDYGTKRVVDFIYW